MNSVNNAVEFLRLVSAMLGNGYLYIAGSTSRQASHTGAASICSPM